jgi:hypothetical protein
MAEQMRPASKKESPDPAVNFDRSDPKREAGQGQVKSNDQATPTPRPDTMPNSVGHAQAGDKQINSEEAATIAPKAETSETESLGWEKPKK